VDKKQLCEATKEKKKRQFYFLVVGEVKFWIYLLRSVAFVWIWIVLNWTWKSFWIFLFLNLTPNLPLCQERQEGIKRFRVCILGTRTREMMNGSRILGAVVMASIISDSLRVLIWTCNVVILRRKYLQNKWELWGFWNNKILEV
jgi:hypothetical protein